MSTTHKIEGWISEWWRRYADTEGKYEFHHLHPPVANCTHCTLIIGGKALTEEEVKAMLMKIRNDYHAVEDIEFIDTLAYDELGIKLP